MSPRERLWPGYSTGLEKEAKRVQGRSDFKDWRTQHECRNNGSSPASPELPRTNPKAYYRTGDGILVKGVELAEGILPVNLQETTPSLFERAGKELKLLFKR